MVDRVSRLRVVTVVAVALVGVTTSALSLGPQPFDGGVIYADFTDVSPIVSGEDVKEHGVTVGKIGQPTLDTARNVAVVPLQLDASAFPLHSDAGAKVTPASLLGERYIEISPGTDSKPALPVGGHIQASRATQAVDLQDVVNTLDDPTAGALASLVVTLGQASNGNGPNMQAALRALAPAMNDTNQLVTVLDQQNQLLGSVIDKVQPVASALAGNNGTTLTDLVDSTRQLLDAAAARNQQLQQTLQELPGTLDQARQTFAQLTDTARSTSTTLADLRPTTDNLAAISKELGSFSAAADPALASANPVLDRANELLNEARPVVAQLRQAVPKLSGSTRDATPIVNDLNNNLANVLDFVRYWALTTNGSDGLSHYFRAHFVLTTDAVTGLLPGGGANGAPDPGTQATPRPRQDTPSVTGGLLQGLPDPLGGVTGLDQSQEQNALGFLLGGL